MSDEPRMRIYRMPVDTILAILDGGFGIEGPGLPDDANVMNIYFNASMYCFDVLVKSASFAPVPHGAMVPDATDRIRLTARPCKVPEQSTWRDRPSQL